MQLLCAPLEGVTDTVFRRIHSECFGGVDQYFIPFISPTQNLTLTPRELRAVSPEYNAGVPVVPQVLTKDPEHFLWAARTLADMGHTEVNFNTGCPSGTVTAKGKGAGMLRDPDGMRGFLDRIMKAPPVPVSIKTRIGYDAPEEWERLLEILRAYPFARVIIHPRTRAEFYSGDLHPDAVSEALKKLTVPVVYNGDLFTVSDCERVQTERNGIGAMMLGRGLLANPAICRTLRGGAAVTREELIRYHDRLLRAYMDTQPPNVVLGRMREQMKYLSCCFENTEKPQKLMRKAKTIADYAKAAELLLENCAMKPVPGFSPF